MNVPTVTTITPSTVVEGNPLAHTVTLSAATTVPTTYPLNLTGLTATIGTDTGLPAALTFTNGVTFNPVTGLLLVPAGVTSFNVILPSLDDVISEATETYNLNIAGVIGLGTILDNDTPTIQSITADTKTEGTSLSHVVTLSAASAVPVTYPINLAGVSATVGTDTANLAGVTFTNGVTFNPVTNQVTVPAGVTTFTITVPSVNDVLVEPTETYNITVGTQTAVGTILDNDAPTVQSITPSSVTEGTNLSHTVTLSTATLSPTTYPFSLTGISATIGTDTANLAGVTFTNGVTFNPVTNQLTVPAGVTTFSITVPSVDDLLVEPTETYNITVGTQTAVGTILDNDVSVQSITPSTVTEGTNLSHVVTLSGVTTVITTFPFSLTGISATIGTDTSNLAGLTFTNGVTFNPVTNQLTVPVGVTSFTITVPSVDDLLVEPTETYNINVGGTSAIGTILDNDLTVQSITPSTVTEGASLSHTVTLSGATTVATTFPFSLTGVSATIGTDTANLAGVTFTNGVTFNPVTNQVTVPAGVTTFTITVPSVNDVLVEPTETYNITVGTQTAVGTILDNDAPTVQSITPSSVTEGTNLSHTVTLSTATLSPTTYPFSLTGISATIGTDTANLAGVTFTNGVTFNPVTNQLTVPAGVTTFSITVPSVDDLLVEPTETYNITVGTQTAVGTILDNDVSVQSITPSTVTEGTNLSHVVTLSGVTTVITTFPFSLTGISATIGTDTSNLAGLTFTNGVTFNPVTNQLTVPVGVTSFTITVPSVDDLLVEPTETYNINVGGTSAIGTILDNDLTVQSITPSTVTEGASLSHTVTLSGATTVATTFPFSLTGVSATIGTDTANLAGVTFTNGVTFNPVTNQVTVPAGVTTFTITVPSVDDLLVEPTETYNITVGTQTAVGTILDNDFTVVSVGNGQAIEGNNISHLVTLSAATTSIVSIPFTLANGSATLGVDTSAPVTFTNGVTYNAITGSLIIPVGVTTFSIVVPTVDDVLVEGSETYGVTVGGQNATGTILDNDNNPTVVSLTQGSATEGSNVLHTVTLSAAPSAPVTYSFSLTNGSAIVGTDTGLATNAIFSNGVTYNPVTGQITVPAGVTNFTVSVPTTDDGTIEPTENYVINIGGSSNLGLIYDNDSPSVTPITVTTVSNPSVVEGGNLNYTIGLSGTTTAPTVVNLALANGTGTVGTDTGTPIQVSFDGGVTFTNVVAGAVTVPAGVTSFITRVPTIEDLLVEGNETILLNASTASNIAPATGTGTIIDNDGNVNVVVTGITNGQAVEGNGVAHIVTLSSPTTATTTFTLNLTGVTATLGTDTTTPITFTNGVTYNAVTGQITVPAGVTSFGVVVPTIDDATVEPTETYNLTIGTQTAVGSIIDNDAPTVTVLSVGNGTATEGTNISHLVTLSAPTTSAISVPFNFAGVSATLGSDTGTPLTFSNGVTFNAITGQLNIPAGVTTFSVTVPTIDDVLVELTETYTITVGGQNGTGTILDNDTNTPTVLSVGNGTATEGTNISHLVTLSAPTTSAISVPFNFAGVSATLGSDTGTPLTFSNGVTFNAITGQLNIPAGVTTFSVTVPTIDDVLVELTETYTITVGGQNGTGTILDNDTNTPTVLSVGNGTATEGTNISHLVTLSAPTTSAISVPFNFAGVSATLGSDTGTPLTFSNGVTFNAITGQLNIPAGVTTFSVTVPTIDDVLVELTETYTITVGGQNGTGTILDNDTNTPTVLSVGNGTATEGTNISHLVTLSAPTTSAISVPFNFAGVSATLGSDTGTPLTFSNGVTFNAITGQLNIPAGVTTFSVTVPTIDDVLVELTETYTITVGGQNGTGTILDNDTNTPTVLSVGNGTATEGTNISHLVTLSAPTTSAISVPFNFAGVSATLGSDTGTPLTFSNGVTFNAITGQLNIPAGVTTFSVTVPTIDDVLVELTETYTITVGGQNGTGTILDNDTNTPTVLSVGNGTATEGTNISHLVTLSAPTTSAISVPFNFAGVSATLGSDTGTPLTFSNGVTFNAITGQLNIPAGVTTFSVTVPTIDDVLVELTETYTITVGGQNGTGTILDNDTNTPTVLSVGNGTATEGTNISHLVTLSAPTTSAISVPFNFAGVSATLGSDTGTPLTFSNGVTFNAITGQLNIPAGVTTFSVTVPTIDDVLVELTETYTITVGGQNGTGTILDNDTNTPTVLSVGNGTATEGTNISHLVTLSAPTTSAISVPFNFAGVSATLGSDTGTPLTFSNGVTFNAITGQLNIPAGVTTFSVTVPTIDDVLVELTETYTITVGGQNGTGTILDNDTNTPTVLSVGNGTATEGTNISHLVTLSAPTTSAISVPFNFAGVSATLGSDTGTPLTFSNGVTFNAITGQLNIPAGVTTFSVTVPTIDDVLVELTETYTITVGGQNGTGTILDNDTNTPTVLSVGNGTATEGTNISHLVTLSAPTTSAISVPFNFAGVSATLGSDTGTPLTFSNGVTFNAITGQLNIPAGVTTFSVTVPTIDDVLVELTETYTITVGGQNGTGTILDNDNEHPDGTECRQWHSDGRYEHQSLSDLECADDECD